MFLCRTPQRDMEFLLNPCYRIEPDVCLRVAGMKVPARSDESLGAAVFTRCVPPRGPVESADEPVGLC